jgi:WD40 repeat protein
MCQQHQQDDVDGKQANHASIPTRYQQTVTDISSVGTRHVKVWKVDELNSTLRPSKSRQSDMFSSSTHKALPGRNCTLGSLQDATFTSVCQVAPNKAVVASERGDLCLIDETEKDLPFSRLASAGFAVSSMAVDERGRLHLSNCHGELKTLDISDLLERSSPPPSPIARVPSPTPSSGTCEQVGAVVCLADYIVTVDAQRAICLSHLVPDSPNLDKVSIGDVIHSLPAHGDSVLGVDVLSQPNHLDAAYYTWAAGGTVIFWGQDGSARRVLQITIEQIDGPDSTPNELRTVRASSDASFLVTGDKLGVLRIKDCRTQQSMFESKAHAGEITRIAIMEAEASTIVACASRDRTVQIFARDNNVWDLMQTLDEHAGAVNGVMFSRDGTRLVSSSGDRSIVVRELVSRQENGDTIRAFVMLRAVMLKATPVSMAWDVDQEDVLLVSTMDRQVHKYDLRNGQCMSSFRASDTDGGDAVVLSSLAHIPRGWGSPLIAGVSSTDKSIRIYDESGTLIARDWGHTEGVTDIAFVSPSEPSTNGSGERSLVTVAVDGTIFVWGLALQSPHRHDTSRSVDLSATSTPSNPDFLATKPPLRRVISQSELARFQRSSDEGRTTPTGNRSPKLRKKSSKSSFQGSRLDAAGSTRENRLNSKSSQTTLRRVRNRSPSPPSPRQPQAAKAYTGEPKTRSKAALNEFGSLNASTEVLCRNLRTYRKRLANSTETLSPELAKEVERELATTARTVGERVTTKDFDETAMLKLLDQYSDRLVTMLDEKIAATVALRLRCDSEAGSKSPGSDCGTPILMDGEGTRTDTPSPKTIG